MLFKCPFKIVFFFPSLILCGCHTYSNVQSDIVWKEGDFDIECVKKAVEQTGGVEFLEVLSKPATFFSAYSSHKRIIYKVLGNEKYNKAEVGLYRMSGKDSYSHSSEVVINGRVSDKDKEGFDRAIREVNKSLEKYCSSLEEYSPPVKSRDWFAF